MLIVNGTVRPVVYQLVLDGRKQPRFAMAYQEPGAKQVLLCTTPLPDLEYGKPPPAVCARGAHLTSTQARGCAAAKEWIRRLTLYGYPALEVMQRLAADVECARGQQEEAEAIRKLGTAATYPMEARMLDEAFGPPREK